MKFTPAEQHLYDVLSDNVGDVVTIDDLAATLETDSWNSSNLVAVHIRNIRTKLADSDSVERIETVRGVGYKLIVI